MRLTTVSFSYRQIEKMRDLIEGGGGEKRTVLPFYPQESSKTIKRMTNRESGCFLRFSRFKPNKIGIPIFVAMLVNPNFPQCLKLISSFTRILKSVQLPNGGFPYHTGEKARPDATAWAIISMSAWEFEKESVARGRAYLVSQQAPMEGQHLSHTP